jgi:protoporphyrin/coproporphyrin ferrochelatase
VRQKLAIVLFNLGGPDGPEAVQPFLQNLFSDPAIIGAPLPIRALLARVISRTRTASVRKNYAMMDADGGSPLLRETRKQADALTAELARRLPDQDIRVFIAMRYYHPFTADVAADVAAWAPDETVLLPLYPQFSTTTTGSSLAEWRKAGGLAAKTVCCYPFAEDFIAAHVSQILDAHQRAGAPAEVTLLLSAHGLPESIVRKGDPYQWQCEAVSDLIAGRLPHHWNIRTCYQSRVGPLKWIGPSTEDEVEQAAKAGRHILIAPIAFVSEHIETLVELGIEYRDLALKHGAASYTSAAALGTHPDFIGVLATEAIAALGLRPGGIRSCAGERLCPAAWSQCPQKAAAHQAGKRVNHAV